MKKTTFSLAFFTALFASLILINCGKKEDPAPAPGTTTSGTTTSGTTTSGTTTSGTTNSGTTTSGTTTSGSTTGSTTSNNIIAEKNTIVIDGVKIKLEMAGQRIYPNFEKVFWHSCNSYTPQTMQLEMYFAGKPTTGIYPFNTERIDYTDPTKGKCNVNLIYSFLASSNSNKCSGNVQITANGNEITVVINNGILIDMSSVTHTISVNYTSIGSTPVISDFSAFTFK